MFIRLNSDKFYYPSAFFDYLRPGGSLTSCYERLSTPRAVSLFLRLVYYPFIFNTEYTVCSVLWVYLKFSDSAFRSGDTMQSKFLFPHPSTSFVDESA